MPTSAEPAGAQGCNLSKPGSEGHPHRSESEMGGLHELGLDISFTEMWSGGHLCDAFSS